MYSTFEQASSLTKVEHVGAVTKVSGPVMEEPEEMVDIRTSFNDKLPTLLFVGGSAGARVFNQLVTDHKEELTSRYNIINLTGDARLNELSSNLYRVDYATELYQPLMNMADVVITRVEPIRFLNSLLWLNCTSLCHWVVKPAEEIRLKMQPIL